MRCAVRRRMRRALGLVDGDVVRAAARRPQLEAPVLIAARPGGRRRRADASATAAAAPARSATASASMPIALRAAGCALDARRTSMLERTGRRDDLLLHAAALHSSRARRDELLPSSTARRAAPQAGDVASPAPNPPSLYPHRAVRHAMPGRW